MPRNLVSLLELLEVARRVPLLVEQLSHIHRAVAGFPSVVVISFLQEAYVGASRKDC